MLMMSGLNIPYPICPNIYKVCFHCSVFISFCHMFGTSSYLSPQLGLSALTSPTQMFKCSFNVWFSGFWGPSRILQKGDPLPATISFVPSPGVGPVSAVGLPSLPWVYDNSSEPLQHTLKFSLSLFFFIFKKEINKKWSFSSRYKDSVAGGDVVGVSSSFCPSDQ